MEAPWDDLAGGSRTFYHARFDCTYGHTSTNWPWADLRRFWKERYHVKEKLSKPLGSKQFGQNHRTRNPSFPSEVCLQTMCFCHRRSQGTGYLKIQRPTRRKELRLSIMRLLKDILRASKLWRVVVPLKPINNDLNTGTWFAFRGTTTLLASRPALNLQCRSASSPTSAVWQNPNIDYGLRSLWRRILTTKILTFVWSRKLISRLICRTL